MKKNTLIPLTVLLVVFIFTTAIDPQNNVRWLVEPKFQDADDFSEGRAAVKLNGKWGYIDVNGKMVIRPRYDLAFEFSEGLAWVRTTDNRCYFIDPSGTVVIDLKDIDSCDGFHEGLSLARKKIPGSGERVGFIDKKGEWAVQALYGNAWSFNEGMAWVELNGKFGYIDTTGKAVVPLQFDDAYSFKDGMGRVRKEGKWGFVNTKGEIVVELKYKDALNFSEGLAAVQNERGWNYINKKDEIVIQTQCVYAGFFHNGLAVCTCYSTDFTNLTDGYMNTAGDTVIPYNYKNAWNFDYGRAWVRTKNNTYAIIDESGTVIKEFPKLCPLRERFEEKLCSFESECGYSRKVGFVDINGRIVIEAQFDYEYNEAQDRDYNSLDRKLFFTEGIACVRFKGKWGYIKNPL